MNGGPWPLAVAAAAAAAAIVVYTYAGYPILLGLLARLRPQRVTPDPTFCPMVTACVPAYNPGELIDDKIASLLALDYPPDKLEILVYSDGATDGTDEIVGRWAAKDARVRLLRGEKRRGKPTALERMRSEARGEVLLLTDARQRLVPGALRAMLALLADPTVGVVTGNLRLEGEAGSGLYWRYETWIRLQESRFRGVVGMTGPIALVRREDLGPLPADLILDDVWIPMRLRFSGRKVLLCQDAIAWDQAFADAREFGRKARTLAGNYQIFAKMPRLLLPFANPLWFETMSHKVARLVCPWALLVLFVACALAGTALSWALFFAQVLFYAIALAGPRAGRAGRLARTFVVLNAAALVGLWRFVRGSQRVTW